MQRVGDLVPDRLSLGAVCGQVRIGLGIEPISEQVTPHSLRRVYTSLRAGCGDDPVYIAEQAGHADMNVTWRIYQKAVKRRAKLSGHHLREFDRALEWAATGSGETITVPYRPETPAHHS